VLAHHEIAGVVLEIAPHAVEMDRVRHHGVVDEDDAQAFAVGESQRFRIGELDAVERPREAFHVAGEVKLDRATWLAAIWIGKRVPRSE